MVKTHVGELVGEGSNVVGTSVVTESGNLGEVHEIANWVVSIMNSDGVNEINGLLPF